MNGRTEKKMEISYVEIENTYHLEKGEIVIVILKVKLMMKCTYLIFMTKQIYLFFIHSLFILDLNHNKCTIC